MLVKHPKIPNVAMPKDRSGRINDEALVLNTGLHNSKAKIKFLKFMCWILLPSPFSTPIQGTKILWAALVEMNHLLVSTVFHKSVSAAVDSTFSEHFWRESDNCAFLVFRTEQPLNNSLYSLKTAFHPQAKGPELSRRHLLLSSPSTVNYCNYHKCTRQWER